MDKRSIKERNSSLDIIRITAFFFVVSVHFFLNSGFYDEVMYGGRMLVMAVMRTLFMCCVPLFMVLSGYLMNRKTLSAKYYRGIFKTLAVYVLASLVCVIFRSFVFEPSEAIGIKDFALKLLDFSAAPYSWYIEMYIGLFLLIPFINIMYHGLENKKQKTWLLITLVFMTALPDALNITIYKVLPSWWTAIYPLTYYIAGCWLSEFGFKMNRLLNLGLLLLNITMGGAYAYIRSGGGAFPWGNWQAYSSLMNFATTMLVFVFLLNIKNDTWGERTKGFLKNISGLCLGAYLVSYVFDRMFYPVLIEKVPVMVHRLHYYIMIVPLVFLCSLLMSWAIELVCKIIIMAFGRKNRG